MESHDWTLEHIPAADREPYLRRGRGLAFVIGPMRGGTTLLRKIIDAHPRLTSPAETWFLLPLLGMWSGRGEAGAYPPKQAAAAIQSHLTQQRFIEACRAFAGSFFASTLPEQSAVFVDKTPPYMDLADTLPVLFPDARFLVLCRDPRGTLWSRVSWKHTQPEPMAKTIEGVARHIQIQASFAKKWADRSMLVGYERLCAEPADEAARVCEFLGVERHDAMVEYGGVEHHEGYGDENSRRHTRPHADSLRRWEGKLPETAQAELARRCTPEALATLGHDDLIAAIQRAA
ncbi:MAG: sulfotransferase [Phycisphaerales bacterium]|nr:sulfotransferase [Phycisphaerales bacterium]